MNLLNSAKLAVLGTVGVSAIAVLGMPGSANAIDIRGGLDLLHTPGGGRSFFDFGTQEINGNQINIGKVEFEGFPIGSGSVDTIVQRDDCTFVSGSCAINIEMTNLSLKSENPLNIGGVDFDVFVERDLNQASIGTMVINNDGTFHSSLDVHFKAHIVEIGGGQANFAWLGLWKTFDAWGKYDLSAAQQGKFRIIDEVIHITPQGDEHVVVPVPEPSTTLGLGIALGLGAFFKKESSRNGKTKDLS